MMKKTGVLSFLIFTKISLLCACTTFFIKKNGHLLFGRNYDWVTDAGIVCTNLKGLAKTSMKRSEGSTISWTSIYGSITFNQYGKEFPTGGMNEKGLVVELMWLDETKYPDPDDRPAVGVLQWIQYQLDNCASIDEVIETDNILRISPVDNTPLHYLVADAKGRAATIEFLKGKMVVHKDTGLALPVLTNNSYEESLTSFKTSSVVGNNSLERFAQACRMIQQLQSIATERPVEDYAFDILTKVSQGRFTKWSIVYDITNKSIRFRTNRFQQIKVLSFSAFDFNCTAVARAWDMNQPAQGDISALFENFTPAINKRIIETAAKESSSRITISQAMKEAQWNFPLAIKCR